MLMSSGIASTPQEATARAQDALASGAAAERFGRMVNELGGPADFVEKMDGYLPKAAVERPVLAGEAGFIADIATRDIGLAVVELGGGRRRAEDKVDPTVGITRIVTPGERVEKGAMLGLVHGRSEFEAEQAAETLRRSIRISAERSAMRDTVLQRIAIRT
ncbi:MAG: hypothetical protein ACT6SC_02665, partial [Blastomonas fulva]